MTEDNRIPEIRAAIEVFDLTPSVSVGYLADTIRAILDSAPPAPRDDDWEWGVLTPSDQVHGPWSLGDANAFHAGYGPDSQLLRRRAPGNWVPISSVDAYASRATSERAIPEPTEGQNP